MTIELKPELQALIQKRVESGAFASPEEVIERALEFLTEEEDWLAEHRDEIADKVEEGWAAARRGELVDADQVKANVARRKHAWLEQQRRA